MRDAGDPVELASFYYHEGADELVFLDISATPEGRDTVITSYSIHYTKLYDTEFLFQPLYFSFSGINERKFSVSVGKGRKDCRM